MAKHFAVPAYWSALRNLPSEIQELAHKNFELLQNSPGHPSLNFKRVGAVYSVRVGLHYRALATPKGEDFLWFWIGHHSEYDRIIR